MYLIKNLLTYLLTLGTSVAARSGEKSIPATCTCILAYCCLHGTAAPYLANSAAVITVVPSTYRTTIGDRALPVTAAGARNEYPTAIKASPSLLTFSQTQNFSVPVLL